MSSKTDSHIADSNGILNGNHHGAYLCVSDSEDEIEANTFVIVFVEGEIVVE